MANANAILALVVLIAARLYLAQEVATEVFAWHQKLAAIPLLLVTANANQALLVLAAIRSVAPLTAAARVLVCPMVFVGAFQD